MTKKHTLKYAYTNLKNRMPRFSLMAATMKLPPQVVAKKNAIVGKMPTPKVVKKNAK